MGVCAHLWGQEWPYMRISMAAAMAMYAHIYGPCMRVSIGHVCAYSMGYECAYLWAMNAHIYGSSNGHVCAYLWGQQWPYMRISMGAAVMAM